jgi:hypothetical protein
VPYVREWHQRYAGKGLTVVGVHCPEFRFARDRQHVQAAAQRLGLSWPVLLDNDYRTWQAFANRYWPCKYLIDAQGYLRYQKAGEGGYTETDEAIQALLREANPGLDLPRPIGALRAEDNPGAVCFRTTPELHAGYERGALGNPEGYSLPPSPRRGRGGQSAPGLPVIYRTPRERLDGYFYAQGTWQAGPEHFAFVGREGALLLPYHAASANAVLSPSADPVELLLNLKPPVAVEVLQDGAPIDPAWAGEDVHFDAGRSLLRVDAPRLYALARNPDARLRELTLRVTAPGLALYAFTFTTCVIP